MWWTSRARPLDREAGADPVAGPHQVLVDRRGGEGDGIAARSESRSRSRGRSRWRPGDRLKRVGTEPHDGGLHALGPSATARSCRGPRRAARRGRAPASPPPLSFESTGCLRTSCGWVSRSRSSRFSSGPRPGAQAHHDVFAHRVDRGVRHLREALLEVREQAGRVLGEHRQGNVVPHRPGRLLGIARHRRQHNADVLLRVAERKLRPAKLVGLRDPLRRISPARTSSIRTVRSASHSPQGQRS